MVRLSKLSPEEQKHFEEAPCPSFETRPWAEGPPLSQRRVAIISTAGLHLRTDRPFTLGPGDYYRVIPGNVAANNLVMSHVSTNFDRSGFAQDWNIAFPLDRLRELAGEGVIGSVADFHYSFMGANDPMQFESTVRELAGFLKKDSVDAAILVPV